MKAKIGQHITFNKGYTIELAKGGTANVKAGDKAIVVKKIDEKTAEIVYLTGEAKDLCQNVSLEIEDSIDADYMIKQIMRELKN